MQQIPCPNEIIKKSYSQFKKDSEKWISYIQKELTRYGFKIESTEIFDTNDYKVKYDMEIENFMIDYYIRFSKNGKKIGHHFVLMSDKETHRADEYIEEPYTERGVPPLSRQQKYFYVCPTNKVEKITDRAFENERYSKSMPISKWKSIIKKIVERHHLKVGSNEMSLRNKIIRLAYQNPSLRNDLLPLLKRASQVNFFHQSLANFLYKEIRWIPGKDGNGHHIIFPEISSYKSPFRSLRIVLKKDNNTVGVYGNKYIGDGITTEYTEFKLSENKMGKCQDIVENFVKRGK